MIFALERKNVIIQRSIMKKSAHLLLSLLLATIFFSAFCTLHAAAEDFADDPYIDDWGNNDKPDESQNPDDDPGYEDPYDPDEPDEPEYSEEPETEYIAPVTEYIEPDTEYVAPDTEEYHPETYYEEPQQEQLATEYIALIDSAEPTGFIAPAMDKSVSNKTYSTDYTAGIVSWICVGVGVVVVTAVLVSTKASGRKAM